MVVLFNLFWAFPKQKKISISLIESILFYYALQEPELLAKNFFSFQKNNSQKMDRVSFLFESEIERAFKGNTSFIQL